MKLTEMKRFPLVEAVVLIIVLCMPAAWILPRINMLMNKISQISLMTFANMVRTTAVIAHFKQTQEKLSPNTPIKMRGAIVSMRFGYPTANGNGIGNAVGKQRSSFVDNLNGIFDYINAPNPKLCRVIYVPPYSRTGAPRIITMTPGCLIDPVTGK